MCAQVRCYEGTDNVALDFFGDGANNFSDCYEALDIAALYRAPVVRDGQEKSYSQNHRAYCIGW